ncbi:MAG: hypothetical protein FJX52_03050 [Alphaproteobacteria bacterium]|nr:hypothetical protein [Alphaproteobacteria bacterium]
MVGRAAISAAMAARMADWLARHHLPLWREAGRDTRHGGFHERLDRSGRPVALGYKRTMVQCRQVFTHAHAALLGLPGADVAPVRHGLDFLLGPCRNQANGIWNFKVTPEGAPLDDTIDTYTLAFVLTALAYGARALGRRDLLDRADDLIGQMDRHLLMAAGGYHAVAEPDWRRRPDLARQNPNMHLIEAFMALYEAESRPSYRAHAIAIFDLCRAHFVDDATDTLGEYFDAHWRRDSAEGHRIEPGHHFEWSWLLWRLASSFDRPEAGALAERLFAFADRCGVDRIRGGVYDEVSPSGRVLKDTKRIWPLTEYVKACAVRAAARSDGDAQRDLDRAAHWLMEHYLLPNGCWREHLACDMTVVADHMPGSASYHIILALTEAMRAMGAGARS